MKKKVKSSVLPRSLQLLGMASSVVGKELSHSVKSRFRKGLDELSSGRIQSRIDQARVIAENLSQLKGAAMKVGQLLSLDAADYFPPEAVEILSKLQSSADPVAFSALREVLLEDLGPKRLARLQDLDETPAASASIGQVHRARVDGHDVAVKIQYPGVRESIDSDLGVLEKFARGLLTVSGRKIDIGPLFKELATVLKAEADYLQERRNLDEYGKLLQGDKDYIVPVSVPELCESRVLTMSWERGLRIQDWLKSSPSLADRERLARLVLDLYCREFYEWGFVQTDPNYANFLVREFPLRLVVLDFGATLRYDDAFRRQYIELLRSLATRDHARVIEAFEGLGLLDSRETDEAKELFYEFLMTAMEPFDPKRQPFQFTDEDYARRSREIGRSFSNALKYTPPPDRIIFLHRKLGGIFTLLKRLDVRLDLVPYWERMVGAKIEPN